MNTIPTSVDIAVVGAGPTGLTTALALAKRGVQTMVIERLPTRSPIAKAAAIHSGTLEALRPLGTNDELIKRGREVERFAVRSGDRRLALITFGGLPTPYPYTLVTPQTVTEEVLEETLLATGTRVNRGVAVTGVRQRNGAAELVLDSGISVSAKYVVGADGLDSQVRTGIGVGFPGGYYDSSFLLADVRIDWELPSDEMNLFLAADGVLVVAPMPDGTHRIVAPVRHASGRPGLDDVRYLLKTRGPRKGTVRVLEQGWSARFRIQHRLADRYRVGRVLLAGDAAHVNSPAGGQGMNMGICDALALADVLADVLDGADEGRLDRYETERRPVAVDVVAFTGRMTRMLTSRTPASRLFRDLAMSVVGLSPQLRRRLALDISGIDRAGVRR